MFGLCECMTVNALSEGRITGVLNYGTRPGINKLLRMWHCESTCLILSLKLLYVTHAM